jgi:hypothetical protein
MRAGRASHPCYSAAGKTGMLCLVDEIVDACLLILMPPVPGECQGALQIPTGSSIFQLWEGLGAVCLLLLYMASRTVHTPRFSKGAQ